MSQYATPHFTELILNWLLIFLVFFLLLPVAEEWLKRSLTSYFNTHAKAIILRIGEDYLGAHYTGVLLFLWYFISIALPSFMIAAHEVYTNRAWGIYTQGIVRFLVHTWLADLDFGDACLLHIFYNIVMFFIQPDWRLALKRPLPLTDFRPSSIVTDICCDDYGLKPSITQPDFHVKWGDEECEPKFGARMHWHIGSPEGSAVGTVFRQCCHNEKVSISGRVGKLLPQHTPLQRLIMRRQWRQTMGNVLPYLRRHVRRVKRPPNWDTWVSRFEPRKRNMLNRLRTEGVFPYSKTASSFIKREVAMKLGDNFKDPRWIQGCPLEMTIEAGPYVSSLAKNIRSGLRPGSLEDTYSYQPNDVLQGKQVIYTSGMNAEQIGKSYSAAISCITGMCRPGEKVVVIEDDQSRFDEHITQEPFAALNSFYSTHLPRKARRALERGISKGYSKLGTRYSVPYTMQSGTPDTSVGDTLINAMMKYQTHGPGRKWITLICGDDSLTITTDWELRRCGGAAGLMRSYVAHGMEVEIKVHTDPLNAEFCSGRFYPVGEELVLMPKIGKLLSKLACDTTDRNAVNQRAWLRGISETLINFGKVDILCLTLGKSILKSMGLGKVIREKYNPYKYPVTQYHNPTRLNVSDYYDRFYDLSMSEVDKVVAELEQPFFIGKVYDSALIYSMLESDL